MKKLILAVFILSFALLASCATTPKATENPILGAWEVRQIIWKNAKGNFVMEQPQPGIFIFDKAHYSLQWTPTREARVPFKILSKPTDAEAIAGFKNVVFNAGSYVLTEEGLKSTAIIAKVPGFEGGQQIYTTEWKEGLLHLTMVDEVYPDGSKPDWSGKLTTTFVLSRL